MYIFSEHKIKHDTCTVSLIWAPVSQIAGPSILSIAYGVKRNNTSSRWKIPLTNHIHKESEQMQKFRKMLKLLK